MRAVAVLHHRWFYNSCVISAYVIVTIWQKCLFYVHAGAQNRAQFPEGICVCSFMWCCGNLCHCQYWQGNCYDVSKSLWPSESKVVRRVHVFSCSNWLHACSVYKAWNVLWWWLYMPMSSWSTLPLFHYPKNWFCGHAQFFWQTRN